MQKRIKMRVWSILLLCFVQVTVEAINSENMVGRRMLQTLFAEPSKCGAANFTLVEIDETSRAIKFSWRGFTRKDGIRYEVTCFNSKSSFMSYEPFECSDTDVSTLPRQTTQWLYFFDDWTYYCAIITSGGLTTKISNILQITAPSLTDNSPSVFIYHIAWTLACVFIILMIITLYAYRRKAARRYIATGLLLDSSNRNRVNNGQAQYPPPYTPPSYQNQVVPPPHPNQYSNQYGFQPGTPLGNPPPYEEVPAQKNPA